MFNHMHVIFIMYFWKGLRMQSVKLPSWTCAFKPPGEKLWRWDDRPRLRAENPAPEGGGSPTYSRGRHFEKEKESKSSFLIRTHKEGMNEISIRLLTENKMSLSEWECGYFQGWMSKLFRQMGKSCVLVIWGLFPSSSHFFLPPPGFLFA